jgi:hypothetical protein
VSEARPTLAPGLGVRAWRHHFGAFDLAAHVTLHPGARVRGKGVDPVRPARAPTPEEVALLDAAAAADRPAVEVFTTPEILRERFEAIDPDELPPHAPGASSERWTAFAEEVREFFAYVQAPLSPPYRIALDVRDPDAPPPLLSAGSCRTLLLDVLALADRPDAESLVAAHVNLGAVPAGLVFWNVPLPAMVARLRSLGAAAPPDGAALALEFARRHPACPLVRLALAPGEGALVPALLVAHDVDAAGAADLVVTVSALPGP